MGERVRSRGGARLSRAARNRDQRAARRALRAGRRGGARRRRRAAGAARPPPAARHARRLRVRVYPEARPWRTASDRRRAATATFAAPPSSSTVHGVR
ncbi:MAG: hypothetical protein E6J68_01105 [Deltaproteobacteria bacterium]|nr:MAG: hypothetical protein E6J68_01105 [Deltaproteobacteria bacterium]